VGAYFPEERLHPLHREDRLVPVLISRVFALLTLAEVQMEGKRENRVAFLADLSSLPVSGEAIAAQELPRLDVVRELRVRPHEASLLTP